MSIQDDIETAISVLLEGAVVGLTAVAGPLAPPKVEGKLRYAAVRRVTGEAERLDFGQNDWTEGFAITVWWAGIDRDTRISEWEDIAAAFLADQYLGGAISGLTDSYLGETRWIEAHEQHLASIVAELVVRRVE